MRSPSRWEIGKKKEEDEIKIEGNKINLQIYVHPLGSLASLPRIHGEQQYACAHTWMMRSGAG